MTIEVSLLIAIAIPALTSIVFWIVRLVKVETRVTGHDLELKVVRDDVSYIRRRIDEAIR